MDANLINPFIVSTLHVLETVAQVKFKVLDPYIKKNEIATGIISGLVKIEGEMNGTLGVSFSRTSILAIISTWFGEEMKEVNDDIKDAVGEISNMIAGQVTQKYAEARRSLKASAIGVFMGENHILSHGSPHPVLAIPYLTPNGRFTIEACFVS